MAVFPVDMILLPIFLTNILPLKYGVVHPNWFPLNYIFPKLYKFIRFLDLRMFADILQIFMGVLRVILGAIMCIYMRWCSGYENGLICSWDMARIYVMINYIQHINYGDKTVIRR